MTDSESHKLLSKLSEWQRILQGCETSLDTLEAVTGMTQEAPLANSVHDLMAAYTRSTAREMGCCEDWLMAWWLESHFGARPFEASVGEGPMQRASTLKAFASLVAEDVDQEELAAA